MRFHGKNLGFAGSRPRIGRTALALLFAGIASGSALYTVRAQSIPSEDKAKSRIEITPQAPGEAQEGEQAKLRTELDTLLRERFNLDSRIATLQSRLGQRNFVFTWPSTRSEKLTPEQRKRAEEAVRKAQDELRRAEQAVRDAERALPGSGHLYNYMYLRGDKFVMPRVSIPAVPPIPPMPEMKFWYAPDGKSFNWNSKDWSDKDRAEWDKQSQAWAKEFASKWKSWSQDWEKSRPEFEKQMRDYQEKMKQWQKSFQDQWHGSLHDSKEAPEAKEQKDAAEDNEKAEATETQKHDEVHTSEDTLSTPPAIQPI